ncbi:MAG: hypothetical protein ACR2JY_00305 [Chloroflexota bacterium]
MTANYCLTLFDTAGIQNYIFGANRLKENIGASFLVGQALDGWLQQACRETLDGDFAWWSVEGEPAALRLPDESRVAAELLYAGGGNAAVLFRDLEAAVQVVRCWSKRILLDAPGQRVAVAHQPFSSGGLGAARTKAQQQLAVVKAGLPAGQPGEGLSLTRICRSTGLAAAGWPAPETEREVERRPPGPERRAARCLSPVAACRLAAADAANAHLTETFGAVLGERFSFTEDIALKISSSSASGRANSTWRSSTPTATAWAGASITSGRGPTTRRWRLACAPSPAASTRPQPRR